MKKLKTILIKSKAARKEAKKQFKKKFDRCMAALLPFEVQLEEAKQKVKALNDTYQKAKKELKSSNSKKDKKETKQKASKKSKNGSSKKAAVSKKDSKVEKKVSVKKAKLKKKETSSKSKPDNKKSTTVESQKVVAKAKVVKAPPAKAVKADTAVPKKVVKKPAEKPAASKATKTTKDNLKRIEGIGPKIEMILNEAGIETFDKIAVSSYEILKDILRKAGSRYSFHNPTTWPQQAEIAASGDWDALKKLQVDLKSRK
ncbi:MAG: hypothetical protein NXI23_18480 [Bacteroidetes bacterium]|nr:hypothetical protein [Bacteroidota bacterium]MDF1866424.1 hypothetical protein [Saprospiraceae bacterium]